HRATGERESSTSEDPSWVNGCEAVQVVGDLLTSGFDSRCFLSVGGHASSAGFGTTNAEPVELKDEHLRFENAPLFVLEFHRSLLEVIHGDRRGAGYTISAIVRRVLALIY